MPDGPLPFSLECVCFLKLIQFRMLCDCKYHNTERTQQNLSSKLEFSAGRLDVCITQILQYQVPYNSHKTKSGSRSPETKVKVHVMHCLDQEIGHLPTLFET